MKEIDRHFILYSKNHYQHKNILRDLKDIMSNVQLLPRISISDNDVFQMLLISTCRVLEEQKQFNKDRVIDIITSSSPSQPKYFCSNDSSNDNYNFYQDFCETLTRELMKLTCFDENGETIMDIGQADPNILPLSEERKKKLRQHTPIED